MENFIFEMIPTMLGTQKSLAGGSVGAEGEKVQYSSGR